MNALKETFYAHDGAPSHNNNFLQETFHEH